VLQVSPGEDAAELVAVLEILLEVPERFEVLRDRARLDEDPLRLDDRTEREKPDLVRLHLFEVVQKAGPGEPAPIETRVHEVRAAVQGREILLRALLLEASRLLVQGLEPRLLPRVVGFELRLALGVREVGIGVVAGERGEKDRSESVPEVVRR